MARINIEDSIYRDMRFILLMQKLGSVDAALGALVRAWSLAQKYYLRLESDRLIPKVEWDRQIINNAIIEVGLAEIRELGVYVCGSEKEFAWLIQKQNAGIKSAESRARSNTEEMIQRPLDSVERPSTSYSYSSSSLKNKELKAKSGANAPASPKIGIFIAQYVKSFERRWGARPDLSGKVQGQIKTFIKDMEINRACELIQVYCQMEDPWFIKKCHDFGTFIENLGKVNIALDTGKMPKEKAEHKLPDKLEEEIKYVRQAIKQYGLFEENKAREWLGERFVVIESLGGWTQASMLSEDALSKNKIAKAIREHYEL